MSAIINTTTITTTAAVAVNCSHVTMDWREFIRSVSIVVKVMVRSEGRGGNESM